MLEDINFWLSIFSIVIPVFATVYTVNNRIKNQNKENHQPYLVLDKIEQVDELNKYKYYLTLVSNCCQKDNKGNSLNVTMAIKNIGYGVATNIKFYNLLNGNQFEGNIEKKMDQNQKLFTTFDIAASDQRNIRATLISNNSSDKGNNLEEYTKILCVYKDLHNNIYTFIICINLKSDKNYDFYAYQPSSLSYKREINENIKQYKAIIKKYRNL